MNGINYFPEAKVWLASGVQKRARKSGMSLDYGQELSKANWNEEILLQHLREVFM